MPFELKYFQKRTLEALGTYLEQARIIGVEAAFAKSAARPDGRIPQYRKIEGLEDIPYICLRLPTGGGKTVLAAYSIRVAAQAYLEEDFPVVLWLVPTNTIRRQTVEALKNPAHPYRQAIDGAFDGRVEVLDIAEVERVRPTDMRERVCVVVGTLATLRVSDTDGRRIYAHHENFEPHFAGVPASTPGLERIEEGSDQGRIKFSFANLLHLHRPLVIMDEAHNARTKLTFEVLGRVSPACVIEFTATPDYSNETGSNVLYRVSAAELKAEEMIKLPVMLTEHQDWQAAVNGALVTRRKLAEIAGADPRLIRPIVLFQAESKDKPVTVDVLKTHLIDNEHVPAESIAVATGSQRELDGINLFDPGCPIEAVITVQALKEGWDCSFAYVFCSVANIRSTKDVEQLLGRVLRMPYAERRPAEELNKAYAHVSSPTFAEAANQLRDSLISMGFEEEEASQFVQQEQQDWIGDKDLPLFPTLPPLRITMEEPPDFAPLSAEEQAAVTVRTVEPGRIEVVIAGEITPELEGKLVRSMPQASRKRAKQEISVHRQQQELRKAPSQRGEALRVPRLCVQIQGELELAEREVFLDANGWSLLDFPAKLPEFKFDEKARTFVFDVQGGQVVWGIAPQEQQLDLAHVPTDWTEAELVRWLDRQVRQPDIGQATMLEFLRRVVADLVEHKKFDLAVLTRAKFILVKVLRDKVRQYRLQAYEHGYQEVLFGPQAAVEASLDRGFDFDPNNYPAKWLYKGRYDFKKHFYPLPGELANVGEEFDCAMALDALPEVRYWVRNLSKQPRASFWLPTSTDKAYPDFVALLKDGRVLVVEYKGGDRITADDAREKRAVGELLEAKSNGRVLFLMAEKRDAEGRSVFDQLSRKVAANA